MKDVLLGTLDAVIKTYKDNLTIVNDEECIYKDNNLSIGISKGAQVLEIIVDYPDGEWAVYTYMRDDSNDEWEESSIERSSDKHNLMQDLIDIASLDIEKYTEAIK